MEAKIVDREELNGSLAQTTTFIPIDSTQEDFPEGEISLEKVTTISRNDELEEKWDFEIVFNTQKANKTISVLSLAVSSCPRAQIYVGKCLEYLRIENGTEQEIPELPVFKYFIDLRKGSYQQASLKFSCKEPEVYILGIDAFVMEQKSNPSLIDVANVERMLSETNVPLSEGAVKSKSFFSQRPMLPQNNNPSNVFLMGLEKRLEEFEKRIMDKIDSKFYEIQLKQEDFFNKIQNKSPD